MQDPIIVLPLPVEKSNLQRVLSVSTHCSWAHQGCGAQTSLHLGQFQSWICSEQHWATEEHLLPNKELDCLPNTTKAVQYLLVGTENRGICSTQLAPSPLTAGVWVSMLRPLWRIPLSLTQAYSVFCWCPWKSNRLQSLHVSWDYSPKNLSIIGVTPPLCAFPLPEGSWKKGWVMRR